MKSKKAIRPITVRTAEGLVAALGLPLEDAVELFNPTASELYIGGWYLSDSQSDLKRYRIPDGTSLPAGGYRVFYQYQFGPADGETDTPPLFTFNSAHGDAVYLSEADAFGNLTGYRIGQSFEASTNAVAFGRYPTSVGVDFVALSQRTFGGSGPDSSWITSPRASCSALILGNSFLNTVKILCKSFMVAPFRSNNERTLCLFAIDFNQRQHLAFGTKDT